MATDFKQALAGLGEKVADGTVLQALLDAGKSLDDNTKKILGLLITLGANSPAGAALGAGLVASGHGTQIDATLGGLGWPPLDWLAQYLDYARNEAYRVLGLSPTQPTRPGLTATPVVPGPGARQRRRAVWAILRRTLPAWARRLAPSLAG